MHVFSDQHNVNLDLPIISMAMLAQREGTSHQETFQLFTNDLVSSPRSLFGLYPVDSNCGSGVLVALFIGARPK
jgi:hypothetical protein